MINPVQNLVEVTLPTPDNFLKVKETLTRIGIASNKNDTLYQSAHILHKKGKYYIVHFKQMLQLDGKTTDFSAEDHNRLLLIIQLLDQWGLVEIVDSRILDNVDKSLMSTIKVVPYKSKENWRFVSKYTIGKKF